MNSAGVPLPCLDTPPLPLWMTEPTELHDLPFQPFYLSLSTSSDIPMSSSGSSFASSASSVAAAAAVESASAAPTRTSSLRNRNPRTLSKSTSQTSELSFEDILSTVFWSTVHASPSSSASSSEDLTPQDLAHPYTLAALRGKYGAARADAWWTSREAQVTWDTQDSRRSVLWFETAPGSGMWESREKPIAKKNVTRSERRREEKERRGEVGSSPKGKADALASPRKRIRNRLPLAAPVEGEAGPSRRSARNTQTNVNTRKFPTSPSARLSPLGDTQELDAQMLSLPASASMSPLQSPASSLSSLPTDAYSTPAPSTPACPLTLLTTALFSSPISTGSSGSSVTAVSPTASEHATLELDVDLQGRARSGSTASALTVVEEGESEVAKGKRKRIDEDEAEDDAIDAQEAENGEVESAAAALRRTTRARSRTSKAQSQDCDGVEAKIAGSAAPARKRRRARQRA